MSQNFEDLRDIELREREQGPFIIAVPCDERNVRNFPLLEELLRMIHQKNAVHTGLPGERNRLWDSSLAATKLSRVVGN